MTLQDPNDLRVEIVHGETYVNVSDLIIQLTASGFSLARTGESHGIHPVTIDTTIRVITGFVELLGHINNGTLDTLLPREKGQDTPTGRVRT